MYNTLHILNKLYLTLDPRHVDYAVDDYVLILD